MHLLSSRHRDEFLAVPELVRMTMAIGRDGREPTLLIRSSSLTLKYLLRLKYFQLAAASLDDGRVIYGVRISDDPDHPAIIWSIVEQSEELLVLRALSAGCVGVVFLFNEALANVAWSEFKVSGDTADLNKLVRKSICDAGKPVDPALNASETDALYASCLASKQAYISPRLEVAQWHEIQSTYITNRVNQSPISIFGPDEGSQQEELGLWLTDNLHPEGVIRSPQVHRGSKSRELTDLLLTHKSGAILIESKALAVLGRPTLPTRTKLAADVAADVKKARSQLFGAIRRLKLGYKVTTLAGAEIDVERNKPAHAIVLVPDLSLLGEASEFGHALLREFATKAGGFLHILDPAELLRAVQAAEMIEARSKSLTRLMAFDYYLMKRFERAVEVDHPISEVLLRFVDPQANQAQAPPTS